MIVTLSKTFTFDAAHRLTVLPADHKCHRLHGHTYEVEIVLSGRADPDTGFLVDYAEIAAAAEPIWDALDHRYLNDIPGLEIPSTEVLSAWIGKHLVDDDRLSVPAPYPMQNCLDGDRSQWAATLVDRICVKESSTTTCTVDVEDLHQEGIVKRRPWRHLAKLAGGKSGLEQHMEDDLARVKFISITHGGPCRCTFVDGAVALGPNCRYQGANAKGPT